MKFDLFGFSLTKLSQYISVFSVMINGTSDSGQSRPGLNRSLLFLGNDPIGFRAQIFWFIIPTGYEMKYYAYMLKRREMIDHPHGGPKKTGGLHQKSYAKKSEAEKIEEAFASPKPADH